MNIIGFDEKNIKQKIYESYSEITKIILNSNPLSLLIQLYLNNHFEHLENIEDSILGNTDPSQNKSLDFVQSIIVSSETTASNIIPNSNHIVLLKDALSKLYINSSLYLNSLEADELVKYSQGMQMNVSGTLYPYFEEEHFRDLISPYDQLLISTFDLKADAVVSGLLKISNRLRSSEFIELLLKFSPDNLDGEEKLLGQTEFEIVAEYFNVEKITNWPKSFLKALSLKPGEKSPLESTNISEILLKEFPIKYKPFLLIDENYYCFSINNLIDNFYRSVLRALRAVDTKLQSQINNIQQQLSESVPFHLFKKLIPKSQIFENVYYKATVGANGRKEWCECDGIIIFDDVLIILEVKGGAFSPVSPFSDQEAFIESLKSLAQNPYEQSLRLFTEYKKDNCLDIYFKENKKAYKLVKKLEHFNFIYACCVTLDDFNEIAAQIEKTEYIKDSELPVWCISINDLRVYTQFFNSTSIFLNYMYQRSLAGKNSLIKVNDELDHIGLHFEYNNYSMYVSELAMEVKSDNVFIPSFRDEIDNYMAWITHERSSKQHNHENPMELLFGPLKIPEQKMKETFKKLVNLLDKTGDELNVKAARYLLLLSTETRDNICKFIESRTMRLSLNRMRRVILTPYAAYNYIESEKVKEIPIIMIFILEASNKIFKDIAGRKRFLMERVIHENEETLCILIGINKNNDFKIVMTQIIRPDQFQSLPQSNYNLLITTREKIKKSRTEQKNS
ncbi:hypothetical protein KUV80_03865 [Fictibacillus nanhaiensis]|uniref:hypothetical protein n=1 Tax=Fictibacillus nanhaiensis TaxID=742169 RepID=UPI001C938224|nr:hypothetical protein [Fictibacillus nanhaiensis]MBY6035770.1 hypothetical protein [Fictibacillus nanhaiensis]